MSLDTPFPAIPTPASSLPSASMQQGQHQQGPTLPPNWQWICCEQDHGTSSTATATSRAPMSAPATIAGSSDGADGMNGLPVAGFGTGREKKQSLNSSGSGSRPGSRLSSPAFGSLASPQLMPIPGNMMTRPHAHSQSLFLKPSSRRGSGIDGQVVPLTAGATLEGQGQRHDRQNLASGWKSQHRSVRSFDTAPGSGSSTPVSLYNYDHASGGVASNSAQIQLQNQLYPPPGPSPTGSIQGHGNMNGGVGGGPGNDVLSAEAQLAQWMTYCCDKDDCVDPFPPATASSGVTATSKDVNPAMDGSLSTYGLGMDHVMFQAMFPGVTSTSGTAFPTSMGVADPAYCCGGGPDCHEPIVDSIGCEGHPQQCGLPECCAAPDGRCAPCESGVNGTGMDLSMKGVSWGCGGTGGMDLHGYPYRPYQMAHGGSQTPMTMGSTTQTTNTPRGAFSAQASPFLQPGNGEAQDFDIGPPAQGSSSTGLAVPPNDGQLEAFLAAVAKGDYFTEEPVVSNGNIESGGHASGDSMMDHADSTMANGHVVGQGKPLETHICHWQNCHAHFGTVQELLSHVSSEHLKIAPSRPHEKPPTYQFGTTSSGGGLESRLSSTSGTGALESRNEDVYSSLANTFGGNGFGQTNGFFGTVNTSGPKNDGLMACLWDDCVPGPESARPFTSAFAHDSEGTVVPKHSDEFAKDLESLRLLSQKANAAPSSVAPGIAHNVLPVGTSSLDSSQQHLHRACHVPVPVQTDNPLDSASAVLKHLLEQHLGTEATNSLLNIAQNHYTSVSAISKQENSKAAAAVASSVPQIPPPRKSSHSETRPPSAQARSSDTDEKAMTFKCRWHGCDKVFDSNTALTEHISNIHVGRGKSKYECLWEGCVRCDNECDSCDEGDKMDTEEGEKRGRKFATRQKVLRHIQSHTGYRPFVCHLCGQSVSEQATLNAHLRRHAEEKPFKCDEEDCDKAFASAASLAVHKRAHIGTKTHVCPHCDRGFIELSNLTKHIRTHTGDKPFSCPLNGCGRAFCRSDQLKRHTMTCRYRKASDDDRSSITPP